MLPCPRPQRPIGISSPGDQFVNTSIVLYISAVSSTDKPTPGLPGTQIAVADTVVRWSDPREVLARARDMSGLAVVEALRDRTLPMESFGAALGVRVEEAESGRIVLGTVVDAWQLNIGAMAHGGFLSALMDAACGLAIHSTLPAGRACPHVQASYRFLRLAPPQSILRCEAAAVHRGRTLAVARAEITDQHGRAIATGESTHSLIDMPEMGLEGAAS